MESTYTATFTISHRAGCVYVSYTESTSPGGTYLHHAGHVAPEQAQDLELALFHLALEHTGQMDAS
jgi:hypothetical protein